MNTSRLLSWLFISIILMTSIHEINAGNTVTKPDFAFPKKVSAQAEKDLKTALREGNGPLTLRAVMDYGVAEGLVDADNLPSVIKRIEALRNDKQTTEPARAMLALLQATVYQQIYRQNRWVYDRRNQPATPLPADYNEWSGEQFRNRIEGLVDTALTLTDVLQKTPLSEWRTVVSVDDTALRYFPTLYDFAAYHAIDILNDNSIAGSLFSINWLCRYTVYEQLRFPYASRQAQRILELYQNLLRLHAGNPYPLIYADVERIEFVGNRVSDNEESHRQQFDLLMELYNRFSECDFSAYILQSAANVTSTEKQQRQLYDTAGQYIASHPEAEKMVNSMKGLRNDLSRRSVHAEYRGMTKPGSELPVKVSVKNASTYSIGLYRLPAKNGSLRMSYYQYDSKSEAPALVSRQMISAPGEHTIFSADTTIMITVPSVGRYVIVPLTEGSLFPRNSSFPVVVCSDIALTSGTNTVLATDPVTGNPIDGVTLDLINYQGKTVNTATTDADGLADLPTTDRVQYITGRKGNDNTAYCQYSRWYGSDDDGEREYSARIFTDLPIYHPGDTVRFSAVVYAYDSKERRVCPDMQLKATLYDVNYQEVDTLALTTDDFGRIEGRFAIPTEGLTGDFSIEIESTGKDDDTDLSVSQSFWVSDYKLPTFEIKDIDTQRGMPTNGDVTVSGKVVTYSGFPMADTKVQLDLSVSKRIWWRSTPEQSFYTTDTLTDADGSFSIVLPATLLADAPIANGTFTASLTALSATGESQTGAACFTQGPAYSIAAAIPEKFDISANPLRIPVRVTDIMDNNVEQTVLYRIMRGKEEILSGSFKSTDAKVDWSNVPSGRYTIEFALADSTLADPVSTSDRILYRLTDAMPPIDTALWVPRQSLTANRGAHVEIPYGTTNTNAHILVTVCDEKEVVSRRWLTPAPGNHRLTVEVPADGQNLKVTFATVSDYEFSQSTVSIYAKDVATFLDVTIGSFRDRIIPGDRETWTITVTDNTGSPRASAVLLDMYAKAINELAEADFRFDPRGYYNLWNFNWYNPSMFSNLDSWGYSKYTNYRPYRVALPSWQLYGKSFISNRNIFIRGSRMMMNSMAAADMEAVKEHAEEIEVTAAECDAAPMEEKEALTGSVSTQLYGSAAGVATADEELALDEVVTTGYGTKDGGADNEAEQSYRMPEMPVALFEPMLTTDAKGHLTYSFTAPNANTTWQLCATAFTDNLLTGTISEEIISSKPVMVQPNLPRFLRTGDRAVIRASVMNNTDSTAIIGTRIDIFDPATGHISDVRDFTDTIAPHRSAVVAIEVNAPTDNPLLGYRIRSLSGRYYDGEQAAIPVLPSTTPVIETTPFYMGADSTHIELQLPQMPDDARVTLQFCENPAWYCVTALPGLRADDSRTALSASAAIFSAAIAEGLLKSQPELARAIHYWQTSDQSDSTLVSMLEQNSDLKTVLLNATPWMMDARSQTERMSRLALLFDRKEINTAYITNIRLLSKLQRGKGGWGWIEQSTEPSEWITYNVLGMMGRLAQLGWLPDRKELRTMIDDAVAYIDDCAAREFARYPKSDYTQYVMVRDYFPGIRQSTAAKRVTNATVQRLISEWKDQSAPMKAISALILNTHGYNATARKAIESLREYSKTTPEWGTWWPSLDDYTVWSMGKIGATSIILDAFHAVEPKCADVDRIRQWLILQKEAKDWGTSVTTADVIASILTSGSRWTVPAHGAEIAIGGRPIEPTRIDALTGYFRTNISSIPGMRPSNATLTIAKAPAGPAWGAVYSQYTGVMASVPAQACDAVSIEKQLLVQRATPTGMVWEVADSLRTGDRVKVQLTIRAKRDMDYVAIIDDRAAALEPVEQLPEPIWSEGICFYRENRDASTRMFVTHLPKGTYLLTYELFANNAGMYASGIASIQSQYAPQLAAHSAGSTITVNE